MEKQIEIKRRGEIQHIQEQTIDTPLCPEVLHYQEELRQHMTDTDYWRRYAVSLSDYQWLNRDAVNAVSLALCMDPLNADHIQFRGYCHQKLGLLQEAAADFELSWKLNPKQWNSAYYLGMTYFYMHELERARGVYEGMWEITPDFEQWAAYANWYYLTCALLGDRAGAERALSKITEDYTPKISTGTLGNTWDDATYLACCRVYKGYDDAEEVLSRFQKLGETAFDLVTVRLLLGLYYKAKGDTEMTKKLFQAIVDSGVSKPGSVSYQWIIGPCLAELSQN